MKYIHIILYLFAMTFFSFCKGQDNGKLFPNKNEVITDSFNSYDNFFPIATLDLRKAGINELIHIVYVSFDPDINDNICFPKPDYKDEFTFTVGDKGKLIPTFNNKALIIGDNFKKYFIEGQKQYEKAKKEIKTVYSIVEFLDEPDWWQHDQTPLNSRGQKYKFICELEIDDICDDDCKMFVFYDELDGKIKYIYQRT